MGARESAANANAGSTNKARFPTTRTDIILVSAQAQMAKLIKQTTPAYPALAKRAGVQGIVQLNVTIAKNGTVRQVAASSGDPLLVPAAIETVKQWVYRPTLDKGEPVEVRTQVAVEFALNH